ncbi:MAG: hypothetical protein AMS14_10875 [Planctomycetes bacterium DG_20]|nr:MAG: hypothetical protein AMS14_10875 [Planctomycetes bacterium DG_20]
MTRSILRIEAAQGVFFKSLDEKFDEKVGQVFEKIGDNKTGLARVEERTDGNTRRLNWAWGILAAVIVALIGMAVKILIGLVT